MHYNWEGAIWLLHRGLRGRDAHVHPRRCARERRHDVLCYDCMGRRDHEEDPLRAESQICPSGMCTLIIIDIDQVGRPQSAQLLLGQELNMTCFTSYIQLGTT